MNSNEDITRLLREAASGDRKAHDRVVEAVYRELHRLASHRMRVERSDHSLQPSALVNEVYLRLFAAQQPAPWKDREHFFSTAASVMRHVLVDHARSRGSRKRNGGARVDFDLSALGCARSYEEILSVDSALDQLAELHAGHARVVELHFFTGLTFEEIGVSMGISSRTAKRYWELAQRWLKVRLQRESPA